MSDPFDKYRQYDQDLRDAYAAGLDAAREAVAALDDGTTIPASDGIFEALDAIDALRKETK